MISQRSHMNRASSLRNTKERIQNNLRLYKLHAVPYQLNFLTVVESCFKLKCTTVKLRLSLVS